MIKKVNNKGMTLVEIVVVLLIASIIMTITGGILVNSLGYFDKTTAVKLHMQRMLELMKVKVHLIIMLGIAFIS